MRAQTTVVYSNLKWLDLDGVRKQYRKPLSSKIVTGAPSRSLFQLLLTHLHLIIFMFFNTELDGINPLLTEFPYLNHGVLQQKPDSN